MEDLLKYSEINITGGEPILFPDDLFDMIKYIKEQSPITKINLYMAYFHVTVYHDCENIFKMIDGLTYTLHTPINLDDHKIKIG